MAAKRTTTTERQPPPPERVVELVPVTEEGDESVVVLHAKYPWRWFRFMFDDGRTIDVFAVRDDSYLREAVREHMKATKIVGAAHLER